MKVLIIYGGFGLSQEAEISERSGRQVSDASRKAGFDVTEFRLTQDNLDELKAQLKNFDVVFPVLHGKFGEDGGIQQIFENAGIKYVGCGVESSKLCFNKDVHKQKLVEAGILTPQWKIISTLVEVDALTAPIVLKPVEGGASIGMIIARTQLELDLDKARRLLEEYGSLIVEEYIDGQEVAVGILDDTALPVIEIIPPSGEWFDYENKYNGNAQENVPPKYINENMQKQLQDLALQVHRICDCRHLSRTDILIKDGKVYVLETNTMPGMTSKSLYPQEAESAGYDLPALVKKLVELAI